MRVFVKCKGCDAEMMRSDSFLRHCRLKHGEALWDLLSGASNEVRGMAAVMESLAVLVDRLVEQLRNEPARASNRGGPRLEPLKLTARTTEDVLGATSRGNCCT